jgi:hypothetical protein
MPSKYAFFLALWPDHWFSAIPALARHLLPLSRMRFSGLLVAFAAAVALSGCHSAFIDATLSNRTAEPIALIEVDYPSASFGTQTLAPGQDFHYRFKILGSGSTTVLWTDAAHHDHKSSGLYLHEGEEGNLTITFRPNSAPAWDLLLPRNATASGILPDASSSPK